MAEVNYSKLQALIVDDFDSFRMTVGRMLQDIGIKHVDGAVNGAEALRHCQQKAYDLILCDYNLGKGKTGQQVLEELRHRRLPGSDSLFMLISAESSKSIIMAAYDYEPDGYLTKPITNKILEQRLTRLFAQRAHMAPITAAMKENNISLAIDLCRNEIASNGRYANPCQKLLGQLYIEAGDFSAAEAVYREVLEVRQLDWAQVGMARVKKMQGDLLSAQQWLEDVIASNPLTLKAYDLQADIYREQRAHDRLQETLEKAVNISPLSILRQQHLADVAIANGDVLTAAGAYRRAVKLGENSCYDRVENHTGFARATLAMYREDQDQARPLLRDALKTLAEIDQRFGKSADQKMEASLLEAQLFVCHGEPKKAEELVSHVQASVASGVLTPTLDAQIEMVRSLQAVGNKHAAKTLLEDLLHRYQGNEADLEKIDSLLEEPVSARNRSRVAAINKKGIACYESGNFAGAIDCFHNAQKVFPNHMGIRLNLVQALIGKINLQASAQDMQAARDTLARISETLTPDHEQYRRFRQLAEMLRHCESAKKL